jgi:hypothetical protein
VATSEVDIANNALLLLGAKASILSFDDGTDKSNLMKKFYPITRDAVIRAHKWRFATQLFDTVAEDTPAPKWKWDHSYTISQNPYVLRVTEIDGDREGWRWVINGRKIMTDLGSPLNYEAVIRVIDTQQFDSLFEDVLTFRLAAAAAMPFTEHRAMAERLMMVYTEKMKEARTISSQEGYPEDGDAGSPLLNARLSGSDIRWRKIGTTGQPW